MPHNVPEFTPATPDQGLTQQLKTLRHQHVPVYTDGTDLYLILQSKAVITGGDRFGVDYGDGCIALKISANSKEQIDSNTVQTEIMEMPVTKLANMTLVGYHNLLPSSHKLQGWISKLKNVQTEHEHQEAKQLLQNMSEQQKELLRKHFQKAP